MARSAHRYAVAAMPECALNAQPCTVNRRTGTPVSAAASRPSTPALELLAWTKSGRTRRISRTSSSMPRKSSPGLRGRCTCRSVTKRTPAAAACSASQPEPCAATVTSNPSRSAGSSAAT